MKKITILFVLTLFFAPFSGILAQNAQEIVDKHLAAIGGPEKISSLHSLKMEGKMTLQPGMEAPVAITIVDNKALRFELTIQGQTLIYAVQDTSGWMVNPFQGKKTADAMPGEMVKQMRPQMDLQGDFLDYRNRGIEIEFVDKDDMEGTEVYKLKVTRKDGNILYYYIDTQNYFDLKKTQLVKMQDKEMESVTVNSNFKPSGGGLLFPHTVISDMGGQINWENISMNPEIDMSIFQMPN